MRLNNQWVSKTVEYTKNQIRQLNCNKKQELPKNNRSALGQIYITFITKNNTEVIARIDIDHIKGSIHPYFFFKKP